MKGQDTERLAGVLEQGPARWRTLISAAIQISEQPGQRGLQECWGSVVSWLTSISATLAFTPSTSSMAIVSLLAEGPTHAAAAESL
jgi:hypothetical protein